MRWGGRRAICVVVRVGGERQSCNLQDWGGGEVGGKKVVVGKDLVTVRLTVLALELILGVLGVVEGVVVEELESLLGGSGEVVESVLKVLRQDHRTGGLTIPSGDSPVRLLARNLRCCCGHDTPLFGFCFGYDLLAFLLSVGTSYHRFHELYVLGRLLSAPGAHARTLLHALWLLQAASQDP